MEESEQRRVNRELIELLNELRVALPGVQVLFAFLLAIPFAKGFPRTTRLERDAFFGALASAMAATVLLMAPSAYHRILFRHHDKEQLIRHANRLAIAGTTALAVALAISSPTTSSETSSPPCPPRPPSPPSAPSGFWRHSGFNSSAETARSLNKVECLGEPF